MPLKMCQSSARACLQSSFEPKDGSNDVDHSGEARVSLFIACGDASKGFHLTEEIFDEMTPLVFVPVMRRMPASALAKRDDGLNMSPCQAFAQPMGVERLIADKGQTRLIADKGQTVDASHKSIETRNVVAMARQQHEADQIAKRIDDRRNFGRRAAAGFANGLFLSPPFAPVPC